MLSGMVGNYDAGARFVAGKSSVLVGTATLHFDSAGSSTSCTGGVRRVFELLLPGGVLETFVPWHALAISAASKILRDSVMGLGFSMCSGPHTMKIHARERLRKL